MTNYFLAEPISCLALGQMICHYVGMTHITSSEIISKLGEDLLIREIGFTERNLRHIRRQGKFPGGWYFPLKVLCEGHGIYCPLSAFIWKGPDKKHGDATSGIQGRVEKACEQSLQKDSA